MPISFPCPHCSSRVSISRKLAGSQQTCLACGRALTVPAVESSGVDLSASGELSPAPDERDRLLVHEALGALSPDTFRSIELDPDMEREISLEELSRGRVAEDEAPSVERMECPRCAELIAVRAKVCRFCEHDLEATQAPKRRPSTEPSVEAQAIRVLCELEAQRNWGFHLLRLAGDRPSSMRFGQPSAVTLARELGVRQEVVEGWLKMVKRGSATSFAVFLLDVLTVKPGTPTASQRRKIFLLSTGLPESYFD